MHINANIISIVGIVVAVFSSIGASVLSCVSIWQTKKHFKESNRPSISPSYEVICTDKLYTIFKLKNYGNIGASLTSFNCSLVSTNHFVSSQMGDFNGTYFAPGQSYLFWFKSDEITENHIDFQFSYLSDDGRTFSEKRTLKIKCGRGSYRTNSPESDKPNPIISSLQDISEQLLSNR